MSAHLNLSTGKFLNSSTLYKLSDALLLDVSSGEIVMSNLLVPRAGVDLFKLASLDLNFSSDKSLVDSVSGNNLITFSRASTGTYVGSDGLIKTATTNTPRFGHDPVTGESLGLLIEEARTNLLTNSQTFQYNRSQAGYGIKPYILPDQIAAPDGTMTADEAITQSTTAQNRLLNAHNVTAFQTYTYSVFVKYKNMNGINFTLANGKASAFLSFNFSTETVTGAGAQYISGSAGFEKFNNGWYRIYFSASTYASGSTSSGFYSGTTPDERVYLWGEQLEAGSFPTSYISTGSSSVTRSADIASIEGSNFSSWYNQSEGTVFVEAKNYPHPVTGKALVPFAFSNNTYNNRITLASSTGNSQFNFDVTAGGSTQRLILGNFVSSGLKASGGYKSTGSAGSLDGAAAVTSNTPNIPSVISQIDIGRAHDGQQALNGYISRFAYFPTRKADQELKDLTT